MSLVSLINCGFLPKEIWIAIFEYEPNRNKMPNYDGDNMLSYYFSNIMSTLISSRFQEDYYERYLCVDDVIREYVYNEKRIAKVMISGLYKCRCCARHMRNRPIRSENDYIYNIESRIYPNEANYCPCFCHCRHLLRTFSTMIRTFQD